MSVTLSICVPTYNRAQHLADCLRSIRSLTSRSTTTLQVCVSDNGSADDTEQVVRAAQAEMPIRYRRNPRNLGIPQNFLNVVEMADGDFVWLVGDDDLLMPHALEAIVSLIEHNPDVDFFYVERMRKGSEVVCGQVKCVDVEKVHVRVVLDQ